MTRSPDPALPDACADDDVFAVHPSFDRPRLVGEEIGFGATESDLAPAWLALDEDEQWGQLSSCWDRVCEWAEAQEISKVEISQFPRRDEPFVRDLGFELSGRDSALGRFFAGDDSTNFGTMEGDPRAVAEVMRRLHKIPYLNLEAWAGECLRVQLRDLSWDAVLVWSETRPSI